MLEIHITISFSILMHVVNACLEFDQNVELSPGLNESLILALFTDLFIHHFLTQVRHYPHKQNSSFVKFDSLNKLQTYSSTLVALGESCTFETVSPCILIILKAGVTFRH